MPNGSESVTHYECSSNHRAVDQQFVDIKGWLDKIDKRMWSITIGVALAFIGIVLDIFLSFVVKQ